MTLDTASQLLSHLTAQTALLQRISQQLDQLCKAGAPAAPNYRYPLAAYSRFDWSQLDAEILQRDTYGATVVLAHGYQWTRRNGAGKFGPAIWFSRADGKDDAGEVAYLRLVTFKDSPPPEALRVNLPAHS